MKTSSFLMNEKCQEKKGVTFANKITALGLPGTVFLFCSILKFVSLDFVLELRPI